MDLLEQLGEVAHGGHGYTHGYLDLLEMDARDALALAERLTESRKRIARALENAGKPRTR